MPADDMILTNALVVTRTEAFTGTVTVADGRIAALQRGASALPGAIDLGGDLLIPGLVELHTDNLERHFMPRPGVFWPALPAVVAHDAEVASAGITTVFDALRVGVIRGFEDENGDVASLTGAVEAARAHDLLRAEHLFHIRCEISYPTAAEEFAALADNPLVRLVSVMDHTPGQRQFVDESKFRTYYAGRYNLSGKEFDDFVARRRAAQAAHADRNRDAIVAACHARAIPLASHDDATPEHVAESVAAGVVIAEFPTTVAAAEASRTQGLSVLMGAPNVVRGGSHSGNVGAADLARAGLLDILSSDYVPASLLMAAFQLAEADAGPDLVAAIATVTATPAAAVGLDDRGEIAVGRRADLVRVDRRHGTPIVRTVWRAGQRIA